MGHEVLECRNSPIAMRASTLKPVMNLSTGSLNQARRDLAPFNPRGPIRSFLVLAVLPRFFALSSVT